MPGVRIELLNRTLFIRKTIAVFAASFLLLPLLELRSAVPALLYVAALVVLHIIVLIVYVFRVPMRELATSWRGLAARILGLAVVSYLLVLFSRFEDDASRAALAAQLLMVAILHAIVLLLLSARLIRPGEASPAPDPGPERRTAEPR